MPIERSPDLAIASSRACWSAPLKSKGGRVIGTFARLKLRDNKPDYLRHMPRLWRYMDRCLAEPLLFQTQLRAILRASHHGKVKLLIPMLAHSHEIDQALAVLTQTDIEDLV